MQVQVPAHRFKYNCKYVYKYNYLGCRYKYRYLNSVLKYNYKVQQVC